MTKKRAKTPARRKDAILRSDVAEAIRQIWPENTVKGIFSFEGSHLTDKLSALEKDLMNIKGAQLKYQLAAKQNSIPDDAADTEDFSPVLTVHTRSYHLFFICPEGEIFTFESETENFDETEYLIEEALAQKIRKNLWESQPKSKIKGRGWIGWSVSLSFLAPFAAIALNEMALFDDGSTEEPGIEMCIQDLDGDPIHPEKHFRELLGEQALVILQGLRAKIGTILQKHGIVVLPEEEWRKPVPWLKGGEGAFVGTGGQPIRVLDAFFFERA
jgi:hypothetical protein